MYSAVAIVAITVALASAVYSQVHFGVVAGPVFSFESYSVMGVPSILHLEINSSSPSAISELRVDGASSLSGILELVPTGYSDVGSLCSPDAATFFSVNTTAGVLQVSSDGESWIDGVGGSVAQVGPGVHEIIISDASTCTITLPNGGQATYPSPSVLTIPRIGESELSTVLLIPYYTSGHEATAVFTGGIEDVDF